MVRENKKDKKHTPYLVIIGCSNISRHSFFILRLWFDLDDFLQIKTGKIQFFLTLADFLLKIHKTLYKKLFSKSFKIKNNNMCLTLTSVWTRMVGVTTALPQPSGISVWSRTTLALLHPLVRATMVEHWGEKRAASWSDWTWMKTKTTKELQSNPTPRNKYFRTHIGYHFAGYTRPPRTDPSWE